MWRIFMGGAQSSLVRRAEEANLTVVKQQQAIKEGAMHATVVPTGPTELTLGNKHLGKNPADFAFKLYLFGF